jgi:parallel beta-helix repeat protein
MKTKKALLTILQLVFFGNLFATCPPTDLNHDGVTNNSDYLIFAGQFGQSCPNGCSADFNHDGVVNNSDFLIFIGNMNQYCSNKYYVSSSTGDDNNSGVSPLSPWKTLDKLNSKADTIVPGDTIFFKKGDTFYGELLLRKNGTSSRPIVYTWYGDTGGTPNIVGYKTLSNWTLTSPGIYESYCADCGSSINSLVRNNVPKAMGRYPNSTDPNKGYLTFDSHAGNTQITDAPLASTPNWTGAELVIRPHRWVIDRNPINGHSGSTLTYTSASTYEPENGFGYFIQNHLATLDQDGEWYYNPNTKKVYMYFGSNNPVNYTVNVSTKTNLINADGRSYLYFKSLSFNTSNGDAISLKNCNNITLLWLQVFNSGLNGIKASNSNYINVTGITVKESNANAVEFSNCTYSAITYNLFQNTGLLTGMGKSGNNTSNGIYITGSNNTIERNEIKGCGYTGIAFYGSNYNIRYNFVHEFNMVKDDGGGIYTWQDPVTSFTNRIIEKNIVIDGIGAGEGTSQPSVKSSVGIYMDDNSNGASILDNTIAKCASQGLYFHNAHDITATGNTIFSCQTQLDLEETNYCSTCLVRNNTIQNNIAVSEKVDQMVASFSTLNTASSISSFGSIDNNYYCRPLDDKLTFSYATDAPSPFSTLQDLEMWQEASGKDATSHKSPLKYPNYSILGNLGNEIMPNGTFNANVNTINSYATGGTFTKSWDNNNVFGTGGSALLNFTSGDNTHIAIAEIPLSSAVSVGNNYVVKFNLKGAKNNHLIRIYLMKRGSPYTVLTKKVDCKISSSATSNEFLLPLIQSGTTDPNVTDPELVIELDPDDGAIWLDNVSVRQASITYTNPQDYILFSYNATGNVINVPITGEYRDVKNNSYTGSVSIPAYSSVVLLKVDGSQSRPLTNVTDESIQPQSLAVFPNPTSSMLNVVLPPSLDGGVITIYDLAGREMHTQNLGLKNTGSTVQVDMNSFQPGVYILRIISSNGIYQARFVKSN